MKNNEFKNENSITREALSEVNGGKTEKFNFLSDNTPEEPIKSSTSVTAKKFNLTLSHKANRE